MRKLCVWETFSNIGARAFRICVSAWHFLVVSNVGSIGFLQLGCIDSNRAFPMDHL